MPSPDDPWLALGAASRLVGVAPDTLRRWADTGRVESFVTPGGHRRFLRSALEAMMNAPRRHRYGVDRLTGSAGTISGEVHRRFLRSALEAMMNTPRRHRYGVDRLTGSAGTISGEVHRRMARSGGAPPWQARLSAEQRADFRRWGQRTFNLVLEYVAASKRAERTLLLGEAEKMGALYGAEASRAGLSLAEAVEAFLYYRSPVLEAIAAHLRRRAAELTDLTTAYREATAAIDGVLTALVASYREGAR